MSERGGRGGVCAGGAWGAVGRGATALRPHTLLTAQAAHVSQAARARPCARLMGALLWRRTASTNRRYSLAVSGSSRKTTVSPSRRPSCPMDCVAPFFQYTHSSAPTVPTAAATTSASLAPPPLAPSPRFWRSPPSRRWLVRAQRNACTHVTK